MTDHTSNSLSAVITSLTRVVGPAVDESDPLAQQQLSLTVAYLEFLRSRLPFLLGRERAELEGHCRMACAIADSLRGESSSALREAAADAEAHLASATADVTSLRGKSARIAALVTEEIRLADGDEAARIEQTVIAASRDRVELERAWYEPMGFDPSPETIRPLDELLPRSAG